MSAGSDLHGAPKTSVTIVTINGKQFVSGLFWQPLTRPRAYMTEAREIGKREGMDIVAIRHSVIMQAGFVARSQGVLKGMYSLAASLASQLGNSWLGVFEIDEERFALVAVHDGAIVPGCDIIGDRDEVGNKLRVVYNYFAWEKVYAPVSFEFGGEPLDIIQVLQVSKLKKENQLRPLAFGLSPKEWSIVAAVVIAIIGGLSGYSVWKKHQEEMAREAEVRAAQARIAELEKLNANAKQAQAPTALDHPWAKQPAPEDFARECLAIIKDFDLVVGGWLFQGAKCDGTAVEVSYKRQGNASVNDLLATEAFKVAPVIGGDGDGATVTLPISLKFGGDDALSPADKAKADFSSLFQSLGIPIRLVEKQIQTPPPATLPGHQVAEIKTPPPAPDWKTFTFAIESEIAPEVVFSGARANGLRFTKLSVRLQEDAPKLIWNIEGELNAK